VRLTANDLQDMLARAPQSMARAAAELEGEDHELLLEVLAAVLPRVLAKWERERGRETEDLRAAKKKARNRERNRA